MLEIRNIANNFSNINNVNFGKNATYNVPENDTDDIIDISVNKQNGSKKQKADKPNTLKTFAIIAGLVAASALTASALCGRFYNFFSGNTKFIDPMAKRFTKFFDNLKSKIGNINDSKAGKVKKYIKTKAQNIIEYTDKFSKQGIEDKLETLSINKNAKIDSIKKSLIESKKGLQEEDLSKAVENKIVADKDLKAFFDKITEEEKQLKGTNLLKKSIKLGVGTAAGVGTLKEATIDENFDGIPDCVQKKDANKNATKKVTTALIDAALDSY